MNRFIRKSVLISSSLTVGILALTQPASAVIYNWQFTNVDGSAGSPTDIVQGTIEFSSFATFGDIAGEMGIAADDIQLTGITGSPGLPFLGDDLVEIGPNLLTTTGLTTVANSFSFDGTGEIIDADVLICVLPMGSGCIEEELTFFTGGNSFFRASGQDYFDNFGTDGVSTLEFSGPSTASVPFEFSPALGLLAVGGLFGGSRLRKRSKDIVK